MNKSPFDHIMNAKSIAFFGASNNPLTMGTTQITHLVRGGYEGKVFPVHPKEKTVLGVPAYKSVHDIPETPDLAILVLPTRLVPQIIDECGEKGIKYAVIISGGFKERGEEGRELENDLKNAAEKHGVRFVGPNCIGVINADNKFNCTFYPYLMDSGPMGLLSQSGTYVTQVIPYLEKRGIRYSKAVSLGNEANIDLVDGLEYLAWDPGTKSIALYIEGIKRGREFVETAKRVSMIKPIVAYYVGGTEAGARSGASHTGSMGGDDTIHDRMFRQCGIVRAPSIEMLYDWAWALAVTTQPKGRRVAIISHSGGPVTSMADACSRNDMDVPAFSENTRNKISGMVPPTGSTINPVDLTFSTNPGDITGKIPKAIFETGEVDAVLVHGVGGNGLIRTLKIEAPDLIPMDIFEIDKNIAKLHGDMVDLAKNKKCPIIGSSFDDMTDAAVKYVTTNDVAVYPTPERAVMAMAALMQYTDWKRAREND